MPNKTTLYKKTPYRRPWPPAKRARMAQYAHKNRPWRFSTGPRTTAGKAAISQNAFKHGLRSARYRAAYRALVAVLRGQKRRLALLRASSKRSKTCKSMPITLGFDEIALYTRRL